MTKDNKCWTPSVKAEDRRDDGQWKNRFTQRILLRVNKSTEDGRSGKWELAFVKDEAQRPLNIENGDPESFKASNALENHGLLTVQVGRW